MKPRLASSRQAVQAPQSQYQRLEAGYAALGWRLYPLCGETLFVTIPAWGMSRTLPDLAAARRLLIKIGGRY
jgi:hypothetical protein